MFEVIKSDARQLDIVILRKGITRSPGSILTNSVKLYYIEFTKDYVKCSLDLAMTRIQIISPYAIQMIKRDNLIIYEMDPRNMIFGGNG